MSTRKASGIALMVGFAGACVAWNLMAPAAMAGMARSVISAALALGAFLAWRMLVWEKPRKP